MVNSYPDNHEIKKKLTKYNNLMKTIKHQFTDTVRNIYKGDTPLFGNGISPLYIVTKIGSSYLYACTYAFLTLRIKSELPIYLTERASHNPPKIMHT